MSTTKKIIIFASMIWAILLSIAALFIPPKGVIDPSVLILIAQILVLVATILGFNLTNIIKSNGTNSTKEVAA